MCVFSSYLSKWEVCNPNLPLLWLCELSKLFAAQPVRRVVRRTEPKYLCQLRAGAAIGPGCGSVLADNGCEPRLAQPCPQNAPFWGSLPDSAGGDTTLLVGGRGRSVLVGGRLSYQKQAEDCLHTIQHPLPQVQGDLDCGPRYLVL